MSKPKMRGSTRSSLKPNTTQTPNIFFDEWLRKIKTMGELKVVQIVIRYTYGWQCDESKLDLDRICEETGLARASAVAGIEKAMAHGYIDRVRDGHGFYYRIPAPQKSSKTELLQSPEKSSADELVTVQGVNSSSPESLLDEKKVKETKIRPIEKPVRKESFPSPFGGNAFKQTWAEYVGYRKHLGRALDEGSYKHLVALLNGWGERLADERLIEAMAKGWMGPGEPKNGSNGNGHAPRPDERHMAGPMSQSEMEERQRLGAEYAENIRRMKAMKNNGS